MKCILGYLKPEVPVIIGGFLIKFAGTLISLFLPWILSYIIDEIVPLKNLKLVLFWGILMLICSGLAWVGNVVANRMASRVARDTTLKIRSDLFRKISYLSCRKLDEFTIPSLISRLSSDTYNIHQMIGMIQRMGVRAPILLFGGVVVTLTLEPVLTLVLLSVIPFMAVIVFGISKRGIGLYKLLQEATDKMVRNVRENIGGIRVIKALSKTEYEKKRFKKINENVMENEKRAGLNMAISNPCMNLFLNFGLTAVILVGAYRVDAGMCQPGKIIAFMLYFTIILNALLSINRIFTLVSKGTASMRRISEVLESCEEFEILPKDYKESDNHISFENVSFAYEEKEVLSDISFEIKKGETLGIIGTTGSGKTTLIQLLMRFYETDKGVIRINGDNIKSIPTENLRTKFGIAFQNDFLMSDTIYNNVDFSRNLNAEDIQKSTKSAQAFDFISAIPEKSDYKVSIKGNNLSGGQKQRLFISRAFAGKPEILILDDSSSALDYKTDAKLREELAREYSDTTTIIIAQRVSSVKYADKILVLDNGKATGFGTHEHLMENCPQYITMAEFQMGEGVVCE